MLTWRLDIEQIFSTTLIKVSYETLCQCLFSSIQNFYDVNCFWSNTIDIWSKDDSVTILVKFT